jgi:hypothetical protein
MIKKKDNLPSLPASLKLRRSNKASVYKESKKEKIKVLLVSVYWLMVLNN